MMDCPNASAGRHRFSSGTKTCQCGERGLGVYAPDGETHLERKMKGHNPPPGVVTGYRRAFDNLDSES